MLTSTVATLHNNAAHGDDNYLVRPLGDNAFLDAVMDGVTGRRGGEASRAVVEALAAAALASPDDVVAVLEDVNQKLYRRGWGRLWLTTASVVLFVGGRLYVVGAGDSPVLLIRSDVCQPLFSHVSGFGQAGVARVLGAGSTLVSLYRAEVTIAPGDRVLLATDGITENITRSELVEMVQSAPSPNAAAERIAALMATRQAEGRLPAPLGGGFRRDDWTAIVRFFSPAGMPAWQPPDLFQAKGMW
jgi:serine/threonine protein phosphatase PrpC